MRELAIERLLQNWRELVESGDMDAEEMRQSLTEQADRNCRGWDCSLEELSSDPELLEIMQYDENLTDEQVNEWTEIVCDAAQIYLERY